MKKAKHKKRPNHIAKDLRTEKYSQRVERSRKGRGSYNRKDKHISNEDTVT
jgi:stalled ribosome alternative rescue factor ArfA